MANYHDATFYVQVEPTFYKYGGNDPTVSSIRAVAITQKRPERPRGGVVLTKLTIRIPDGAFLPLRPEVIVVIPENMVEAILPIEVIAGDPGDE